MLCLFLFLSLVMGPTAPSHKLFSVLLMVGWIVGCTAVVYFVFIYDWVLDLPPPSIFITHQSVQLLACMFFLLMYFDFFFFGRREVFKEEIELIVEMTFHGTLEYKILFLFWYLIVYQLHTVSFFAEKWKCWYDSEHWIVLSHGSVVMMFICEVSFDMNICLSCQKFNVI